MNRDIIVMIVGWVLLIAFVVINSIPLIISFRNKNKKDNKC